MHQDNQNPLAAFPSDDRTDESLSGVGAMRLLDKTELADELIPAILALGTRENRVASSAEGVRDQSRTLR